MWVTQSLNGERLGVWLAALNSPANSVFSGEVAAIAELKKAQRKCTRVRITEAFRSVLIGSCRDAQGCDLAGSTQPSRMGRIG